MKNTSKNTEVPQCDKAAVSDSCDCYIGNMNGQDLFISNVKDEVERTAYMQKVYKDSGIFKNQVTLTPLQIIDNRKGYVSRFIFCPYCGNKVDWKAIVNNCR